MRTALIVLAISILYNIPAGAQQRPTITGEGEVVRRIMTLQPMQGINFQTSGQVYIKPGSDQKVEVEAQANIIDNLKKEVRGGIWEIGHEKSVRKHRGLTIYITLPTLKSLIVSSSGNIKGEGRFVVDGNLELRISSSGNINLEVEAHSLNIRLSSSGSLTLEGQVDSSDVRLSSSGNFYGYDLLQNKAEVRVSSSGNANLHVRNQLDAYTSSSGSIHYKGNPRLIKGKSSSSGDIRAVN